MNFTSAVEVSRRKFRILASLYWRAVVAVLLVLGVFAAEGAWPVPDVNEPHYIGKAKSFWDPNWIAGDFFLDSADSHLVFYYSVSAVAWLPAETLAWAGRWVTWALLAVAWYRLHRAVGAAPWWAPITAAWFVMLNYFGQMAGEWVVGGFEAKGLAYALMLIALERVVRGRWNTAWICLGGATCLHVLVGGWSAVAAGVGWLWLGRQRPSLWSMWPGLLTALALAAPGIWTALRLTWGIDPAIVREANDIYVLGRLRHHLDPRYFSTESVTRFSLLTCVWAWLSWMLRHDERGRAWRGFVWGALLIAAGGVLIAWLVSPWPYLRVDLLRFYWFRLSDTAVAWGVSLGIGVVVASWTAAPARWRHAARWMVVGVACWYVGYQVWLKATIAVPRSFRDEASVSEELRGERFADWLAACAWAREHTSLDAQFLTPRMESTFKWYARRAEVVTWKDVPQDAPSLVEWWRRLTDIYRQPDETGRLRWVDSLTTLPAQRLQELGEQFDAQYVLAPSEPRLALEIAYQNNSYTIYRAAQPVE